MAIRKVASGKWQVIVRRLLIVLVGLSLMMVACLPVATRPVVKIGLIAPFEGLHRAAGYEALAAVRAALADNAGLLQSAGVDVLPLAMDDTNLPERAQRTAAKLLMDPAVGAVIGPLTPATVAAAAAAIPSDHMLWLVPIANDAEGHLVAMHQHTTGAPVNGRAPWRAEIDDGFTAWAATHEPATPSAYLIYRATEQAIRTIVEQQN